MIMDVRQLTLEFTFHGGSPMKKSLKELLLIKGVGVILAKRFIKAGYDTFDRIVAAGEEGLKSIQGINPKTIPSIIKHAGALAEETSAAHDKKVAELKKAAAGIRKQVDGMSDTLKARRGEELRGKSGKRIETELHKMITALEKTELKLGKRVKRAGKGLTKAGHSLSGLTPDMEAEAIERTLKKARKSLKKIYD